MALNNVTDIEDIVECNNDADLVKIYYDKIIGQSVAAVLIEVEKEKVWLPKSQIYDCDLEKQSLTIKEWIATEKGLI